MPKVLKIAALSLGALVLSSSFALAQTPQPTPDPGQAPAAGRTAPAAPHKARVRKAGRKKASRRAGRKAKK